MKILLIIVVIALFFYLTQYFLNGNTNAKTQDNIKAGEKFLVKNSQQEGVMTTASGLQYKVLNTGTGTIHPKATDKVTVHYHGTLLDGTVFDSSIDRGDPITFGLNQVIKGWTEGVQLMVVGEKTRFFIPSKLAYGNQSTGAIQGGSTLVFDVELIAIN